MAVLCQSWREILGVSTPVNREEVVKATMGLGGEPQELEAEVVLANPANGCELNGQCTDMIGEKQASGYVAAVEDHLLAFNQAARR